MASLVSPNIKENLENPRILLLLAHAKNVQCFLFFACLMLYTVQYYFASCKGEHYKRALLLLLLHIASGKIPICDNQENCHMQKNYYYHPTSKLTTMFQACATGRSLNLNQQYYSLKGTGSPYKVTTILLTALPFCFYHIRKRFP